jgi:hypothetical protein
MNGRVANSKAQAEMKSSVRVRFWLEAGLAALSGSLAILTVFWRDWIETLTGFDPDHHNGSLEWAIVAGLALICVLVGTAARAEWRRAATTSAHLSA